MRDLLQDHRMDEAPRRIGLNGDHANHEQMAGAMGISYGGGGRTVSTPSPRYR